MAFRSTSTRWGGLRLEPYDPQARDADGDGIVQEGTAWERPNDTILRDATGKPLEAGITSPTRLAGTRVFTREGREIQYTPSYQGVEAGIGGTALGDHGAASLGERGLRTVRDYVTPPEQPSAPEVVQPEPIRPEAVPAAPAVVERATPEVRAPESDIIDGREEEVKDRDQLPYVVGLRGSTDASDGPRRSDDDPIRKLPMILNRGGERSRLIEAIRDYFRDNPNPEKQERIEELLTDTEVKRIVDLGVQDLLDAYEDQDVLIAVPDSVAVDVLRTGRVKSQHETATSGGMLDQQYRTDFEEWRLGVPRDIDVRKRPVYGWMRTRRRDDGVEKEIEDLASPIYGRINLRLKDDLKSRATVTFGDSIGEATSGVPLLSEKRKAIVALWYAEAAKNPAVAALRNENDFHAGWINEAFGSATFLSEAQSRIVERAIQEHPELNEILGGIPDFSAGNYGRYIEAQIHGGVDVRDVKAIEVPEGVPDEIRSEIQRLAEPYGIKVGTKEELDSPSVGDLVGPKAEEVGPKAEELDVPEGRKRIRDRIRQKNKKILDDLEQSGSRFGRIDNEYKEAQERAVAEGRVDSYHVPKTREEAIKTRKETTSATITAVRRYLETGELTPWDGRVGISESDAAQLDNMPQDLREVILTSSDDELNKMILNQAARLQKEVKAGRIRVNVTDSRLGAVVEDGKYKTVFSGALTENARVSGREQIDARILGIPSDVAPELHPASGYAITREQGNAVRGDGDIEDTELASKLTGIGGTYGDVVLELKPEVADRTSWGLGDSMNAKSSGVVRMDEDDPEYIAAVMINGSGTKKPQNVVLNMLESERNETTLTASVNRVGGIPAADNLDSISMAGHDYIETNIAGSFDLDEVESIRIPSIESLKKSALPVKNNMGDLIEERFMERQKLEAMGLTEGQIAYLLELKESDPDAYRKYFETDRRLQGVIYAEEVDGFAQDLFAKHGVRLLIGDQGRSSKQEAKRRLQEAESFYDSLARNIDSDMARQDDDTRRSAAGLPTLAEEQRLAREVEEARVAAGGGLDSGGIG